MLDDANHFGPWQILPGTCYGWLSFHARFIHHLVVDGVFGIEPGQRIGIAGIEDLYPLFLPALWVAYRYLFCSWVKLLIFHRMTNTGSIKNGLIYPACTEPIPGR